MSRRPPETPHMLQCPLSGGPTRLPTHQPVHSASDANSRFVVSVFPVQSASCWVEPRSRC